MNADFKICENLRNLWTKFSFHHFRRINMTEYRIEKDSLGELQVPAEALYGVQTQRAVNNFPISGLRPWRAFVWSMATVKRAAAEVNFELGLFHDREVDGQHFTGQQLAGAIIQAAQEVIDGKLDIEFV